MELADEAALNRWRFNRKMYGRPSPILAWPSVHIPSSGEPPGHAPGIGVGAPVLGRARGRLGGYVAQDAFQNCSASKAPVTTPSASAPVRVADDDYYGSRHTLRPPVRSFLAVIMRTVRRSLMCHPWLLDRQPQQAALKQTFQTSATGQLAKFGPGRCEPCGNGCFAHAPQRAEL